VIGTLKMKAFINFVYVKQFLRKERVFGVGKELGSKERHTVSQGLRRAVAVGPTHWFHPSPPPSSNNSTRREAVLEILCFLWNKR
jgi:hypothetical protein